MRVQVNLKISKERYHQKRRREEVTNYFGKARLKKIFYSYISDRPKLAKAIRTDGRLYYEKFRGFEWLTCYYEDYYFKIAAEGKKTKVIALDEYRYNEIKDKNERFNRVFSYYSEDFRPNPKNKDKSLDCYDVAKKISENAEVCSQA